ncbi:MAG: cobalamin (vitamin B12) biosynthesis CbiX protein [uncultured Friedmanniella sp.]|uniref:Cobalamin (Vitamin B12) biosynthesis CbiX protein n=1 Tax=uncultured Friedmanniella sp. TaxID=335381 RepID=A0A6J4JYQ4_9ACTN|nr:sirohydrochlorin chelatase [uncultured Friedmanniella sp.]CAA9291178.1 MAG: cobalamin (vitamin B12) biosynthesis CbiX protein [uncultured Friedmanniella sp.]
MPGPGPTPEPSASAGGSSVSSLPALVGLAHGSRHADGTRSIEQLMQVVAATGEIDARPAFLDLAEPDLLTVAGRLVEAGHRQAVVVPLLFTVAFHATVDVPEAVREAAERTGLELVVAEILGTGADVQQLVEVSMAVAGIPEHSDVLLYAVGSSNAAANEAVHDLAARLGRHRTGRVQAAFGTTEPRAAEVLPELTEPVALVPLFLSPGLLLAPLARIARERGWTLAPPLGDLAAPLVLRRYASARHTAGLR